jgi:hypothetical protein
MNVECVEPVDSSRVEVVPDAAPDGESVSVAGDDFVALAPR